MEEEIRYDPARPSSHLDRKRSGLGRVVEPLSGSLIAQFQLGTVAGLSIMNASALDPKLGMSEELIHAWRCLGIISK